jgi:hypothetical protein
VVLDPKGDVAGPQLLNLADGAPSGAETDKDGKGKEAKDRRGSWPQSNGEAAQDASRAVRYDDRVSSRLESQSVTRRGAGQRPEVDKLRDSSTRRGFRESDPERRLPQMGW